MADVRVGSGSVLLVPDARTFRAMAKKDLEKIELLHKVTLQPQLARNYAEDARLKIDRIRLRHDVTLHPVLRQAFRSDAKAMVNASLGGLSHTVTVNLAVSTALATAEMTRWRRSQEAQPLRIRVVTDRAGGVASAPRAATPGRDSDRFGDRFTERSSGLILPSSVDFTRAERQVDDFVRATNRRAKISPDIDTGRIRRRAKDLTDDPNWRRNLKQVSYQWNDAFRLRIQPNVAGLQLRLPLGALGLSAIPAALSQIGSLTASIVQLSQAGLMLPGMFAAAGASIATFAVGISGLKEAWKALGDQEKHSSETATQQRADQRQLTDAVKDQARARRDLATAVQNEQRRQRDLALQLKGARLSEAEAILEVQDAEAELRSGRFANERERDHALLRFEESKQNLLEVRNRNADLAQDVAKNEQTGVKGSEAVLAATEALTAATERVSEAQQQMAEGSNALQAATAKAQEAMGKLAPSARQFMQTLWDMRPAFREFSQGVQENLGKDMGPAFQNMFNSPSVQTNLRNGMQGLASQLNLVMRNVMGNVASPETGGLITRIFAGTGDATNRLATQVVNPLMNSLLTLSAAGSEGLGRLTDGFAKLMTRFDNFISKADKDGSLDEWINKGMDAMTQFGRSILNIGSALTGITRAFGGGTFGKMLEEQTKKLADFLNSAKGQSELKNFITETKVAMQEWKPILKDLPTILHAAFESGRAAVEGFLPLLKSLTWLLRECPGLVSGVVTAFVAWRTIHPIVTGMSSLFQGLSNQVVNFGTRFGPAKAQAKEAADGINSAFKAAGSEGSGMAKLATKTSNLATAFAAGGPLVAALTFGAMIALDNWMQKEQDAAQVTENLRRETEQLADTLDRTTGLATQATRDTVAKSFADFRPADKGGLGSQDKDPHDVIAAAAALGLGGPQGQDLVTAALPAGQGQYDNIMKNLRDRMRPQVRDFINNQGLQMGQIGLTEDELIDAFLGNPTALAKIREKKQLGVASIDLGTLADQVRRGGGQGLQAALVGQALNQEKYGLSGAGRQFATATGAARQPVGLNLAKASIFGTKAAPSFSDGQFKIVSDRSPDDPNIKQLVADANGGVTVIENPPGTTDYKSWTYTLSREKAKEYMTGVPEYDDGGPSDREQLAVLHGPEYVVSSKGTRKYPRWFLDDVNQGKYDLPHYDIGGLHDPLHDLAGVAGGGKTVDGDTGSGGVAGVIPNASDIPIGAGSMFANGPMGILGSIFGISGGSGGAGAPPDLGQIAGRFGQILLSGVLGFFGINPQYLDDINKVLGFGLGKLTSPGYSDPNAKDVVEGAIASYDADGNPVYYSPGGQPGTPSPDAGDYSDVPGWSPGKNAGAASPAAAGPGVGAAAGAPTVPTIPRTAGPGAGGAAAAPGSPTAIGTAPGGRYVAPNPNSRASFGGDSPPTITPELLRSKGINPIYNWATGGNMVPGWAKELAKQFGLTVSTYDSGGTLHQGGYAFDFNDPDAPGGSAKLDAFAEFVQTNLRTQTLQLIHQSTDGSKKWGIAAGSPVGPGTKAPGYYAKDFGGHADHVHWATDMAPFFDHKPEVTGWWHPGTVGSGTGAPNMGSSWSFWNRGGGMPALSLPRPTIQAPSNGPLGSSPNPSARSSMGGLDDRKLLEEMAKRGWIARPRGGGGPQFTQPGGLTVRPSGARRGGKRRSPAPSDLQGIKAMAYQMYMASGLPPEEWEDFDALIQHESAWSPTAQNPGSTAHGLGQFLDSTWATVGGSKTDDPAEQLKLIFTYLRQRQDYGGSPRRAWQLWQQRAPHWYDYGGPLPPGLTLAWNQTNKDELVINDAQKSSIASAIARPMTAVKPAGLTRSGVDVPPEIINEIPRVANSLTPPGPQSGAQGPQQGDSAGHLVPPPAAVGGPPLGPQEVKTADAGQGIAPSATGDATQPEVAAAPKSTDHLLPAVRQGIESAADTIGAWAATAASMGMAAGGGGAGGGAAGMMIGGGIKQIGKIVSGVANVGASALVGNITPGTTDNPYGVQQQGQPTPPLIGNNGDYSTHYHGDLYSQDMDDFFRRQQLRDAQNLQSQLNAKPGYY